MRKLLFLAVVLFAPSVWAQETYSLTANTAQVADLTLMVTTNNERTCDTLRQPLTCNQAQACTAANAAGGSSCTSAQARAANARIFPNTQAGREEFVAFGLVAPRFQTLKPEVIAWDQDKFCRTWRGANQTTREGMCTSAGLPATCTLCVPQP